MTRPRQVSTSTGKEVGAGENVHVPANEVPPGGGLAPLRHRGDAMPAQDVAHGLVGHRMSQVGQCSYNPVVAPAGVLASQANHQILDLWIGAWPARRAALLGAVEFLSHQSAIREWYRVWRGARPAAVLCALNACRFPPGWPARHRRAASLAADVPSKCGSRPPGTHSRAGVPG